MAPVVNPLQSKVEHRRQQLEKWKEEKEKKKMEAASKKKKPFVAEVPHAPHKFVPPPPPPKPMPSTSGSVTRSQSSRTTIKEMKQKLNEGLFDEDASNMDHFRRQLASEIKRMTETCDTWGKILGETVFSDSQQEAVLVAVGQARLLMAQTLQQFASLVERCARPEPGSALVTPADLHVFWDLIFMQVENVDMRFEKLEELRQRDWVEEQPVEVKKKVVRPALTVKKAAKPAGGPSRLRDMIAGDSKTFEAGFFSVRSPVRSPGCAPATQAPARTPGSKSSLLKAVLSSEAKKASANKVENVGMRFKKLEELRQRDWVEEQPVEVKKKVVRPALTVKKAAKPAGGPSRLRDMIAGDSKTFEAGFFSVRSPVRSPGCAPATQAPARTPGSKSSLLKAVLSSEAKKASANDK